ALLGSVSDYLVRHLNIPLLLMHSQLLSGHAGPEVAFHRVLLPLDGSELAAGIIPPAMAFGGLWNVQYHLVRVISPPQFFGGLTLSEGREVEKLVFESAKTKAQHYLESVTYSMGKQAGSISTRVLVHRKPVAAILQEAAAADCDLIAISTSGRGGLARLLVGSVTDKVLRGAETPVLVYRPGRG